MNTTIRLYHYRLPLSRPLPLGPVTLHSREGLLLYDPHRQTWGEAAPLPGFSRERLIEVIHAARCGNWQQFPSLEFAFASLDIPWPQTPLPVNALLMGTDLQITQQASRLANQPVAAVKLKVGSAELDRDVQLVRRVRSQLRDDQQLRLDANRKWSTAEANDFMLATRELNIQYIEEPCNDSSAFESLSQESGIPYALDETLHTSGAGLEAFPRVGALVLKPSLLGAARLDRLLSTPFTKVFSSSFESGIGLLKLASLAGQHAAKQSAGLDTYRWLQQDVLAQPLPIENGRFDPHLMGTPEIRTACLTAVD